LDTSTEIVNSSLDYYSHSYGI